MKHLLNVIIREYAQGPFSELVLGGGLGGGADTLLRFKRGFSKDTYMVRALRVVIDTKQYARLCGTATVSNLHECYFPAYRDLKKKE